MRKNTHIGQQLSFFDIVLEPPKEAPPIIEQLRVETKSEQAPPPQNNICTYRIPTIEEIMKDAQNISNRYDTNKLLTDLFECGALAISNLADLPQKDAREERYKEIITQYNEQERYRLADTFGKIFALLSSVVYDNGTFDDYLGEIFMRSNMANGKKGQVFTPYHVAEMMARMTISESVKDEVKNDKILTIGDPCCGSGAMSIGALDVLKSYGVNYTRNCFIECSDVDLRCVHMTYLQLSLAGVPAIIKHQNTLTQDTWSIWKTPAFIFQYTRFHKYENLN